MSSGSVGRSRLLVLLRFTLTVGEWEVNSVPRANQTLFSLFKVYGIRIAFEAISAFELHSFHSVRD